MTAGAAWVVILCGDLNPCKDERQNTHLAIKRKYIGRPHR